jgi:hypothetical protein
MEEGSFEEEEEHVLLQLEGYRSKLTQKGLAGVLELPERMEEEVILRVGKTTMFRGHFEPLVGTALVFAGTDTSAPVCVTRSAVLRCGRTPRPKKAKRELERDDDEEKGSEPPVVESETPEPVAARVVDTGERPQRQRKRKLDDYFYYE